MRRTEITQALGQALNALPLDIEVWLYGSEARGEARADSDIDILVLFNKAKVDNADIDSIYQTTYPIELDSGVLINPFILSKQQWEARMTPFRLNVLNDGVRI